MAIVYRVEDEAIGAGAWKQRDSLPLHVLSLPLGAGVHCFLSPGPIAALRAAATTTKALTAPFLCESLASAIADEQPCPTQDVSATVAFMRALHHLGPHLLPLQKLVPMVLSTIVKRLVDPEPRLRSEALRFLNRMVPGGSAAASAAIQQELRAQEHHIGTGRICIVTAMVALGMVAVKGDADTIAVLANYLGKADVNICMAAGQALARMAGRGNKHALSLVAQQLACEGSQQEAAWIAFRRLAKRGDVVAVDLLISKVDARNPAMCKTMLDSLRHIAIRGDKQAVEAAQMLLDTENQPLRAAAVAAYGGLANRDDPDVQSTLTGFLEDDCPAVRQAARQALSFLTDAQVQYCSSCSGAESVPEFLDTPKDSMPPAPRIKIPAIRSPCKPHTPRLTGGFRHRHRSQP